jgi:hypothetical protein
MLVHQALHDARREVTGPGRASPRVRTMHVAEAIVHTMIRKRVAPRSFDLFTAFMMPRSAPLYTGTAVTGARLSAIPAVPGTQR